MGVTYDVLMGLSILVEDWFGKKGSHSDECLIGFLLMDTQVRDNWKGIVLAGGAESRLYPNTLATSKQLLPIYDKPMIYYPMSTLMRAGIRDILIISTPQDIPRFEEMLGDGSRFGISLSYIVQPSPDGIPQAFLLGESFIGDNNVCMILGDNLFYRDMKFMREGLESTGGATVFGYKVKDPERYGVVEFDDTGRVLSLEEKPSEPKSNYAIPGLYCYDSRVAEMTRQLTPSPRGELEITDLNRAYLNQGELRFQALGRGIVWLDAGTPASLLEAANFVESIEDRQGTKVACLEEIALRMGYLDADTVLGLLEPYKNSDYVRYVQSVADELG